MTRRLIRMGGEEGDALFGEDREGVGCLDRRGPETLRSQCTAEGGAGETWHSLYA